MKAVPGSTVLTREKAPSLEVRPETKGPGADEGLGAEVRPDAK